MLSHYGWIMAFDDIDHADIGMTAGRVYVHKRDVVDGDSLAQGDVVSFYLYADDHGLGAECCQVEQSASARLSADADEFVPIEDGLYASIVNDGPTPSWNMCAAEFVPTSSTVSCGLSVEAAEFVPSQFSKPQFPSAVEFMMNSGAPKFSPAATCSDTALPNPNVTNMRDAFFLNPAFFSDDESDDESSIASNDDCSGHDGDKESNAGDKESTCDESMQWVQQGKGFEASPFLDAVLLHAPFKKSPQASSDDDSTSAGASSDSDEDALVRCALSAPPGLSLPAGWRPPPGLSLPVGVA